MTARPRVGYDFCGLRGAPTSEKEELTLVLIPELHRELPVLPTVGLQAEDTEEVRVKTGDSPPTSSECRVRARRLLNQLRRADREEAAQAAARLRLLRSFSDERVDRILEARGSVKLKHALAVVALEQGYESWRALKEAAAEATGRAPGSAPAAPDRETYDPRMDVFLNRWFARYGDAHASLEEEGGFLFPYGRQFFVCEEGAIRVLGLDPADPDWGRIGHDWAKPRDPEAWQRLREKRKLAPRGEGPPASRAGS